MKPTCTLTIRKRSTGHKIAALAVDSIEHAWTIANILMRTPEYARCYIIAIGWDGVEIFTVGFATACPTPPTYAPALPQAPAYSRPHHTPHEYPAHVVDAYAVEVVDAEPSPYGYRLPPRRG